MDHVNSRCEWIDESYEHPHDRDWCEVFFCKVHGSRVYYEPKEGEQCHNSKEILKIE